MKTERLYTAVSTHHWLTFIGNVTARNLNAVTATTHQLDANRKIFRGKYQTLISIWVKSEWSSFKSCNKKIKYLHVYGKKGSGGDFKVPLVSSLKRARHFMRKPDLSVSGKASASLAHQGLS